MKGYLFFFLFLMLLRPVEAAHFVIGNVGDSFSGEDANGHIILVWNPAIGISDNLTDIIGPTGNSYTDNVYMLDCELLDTPCEIGDELKATVLDSGDGHFTGEVNLSVTGAGFDVFPMLRINSPPNISSVLVEDSLSLPANQIDLIAASYRKVYCEAIVEEFDGDGLENAASYFYTGSMESPDDNNTHYSNHSCSFDSSYGNGNETNVSCSFLVWYYAEPGIWECFFSIDDNLSLSSNRTDSTAMNTLLSIGLADEINYSVASLGLLSEEVSAEITNYGNVMVNLSISGYGENYGDGLAMACESGGIPIEDQKFNLSESNPGGITLDDAEVMYRNMTESTEVLEFNLDYRKNEDENDAKNSTYWRIFAPSSITPLCNGSLVFGAVEGPGE